MNNAIDYSELKHLPSPIFKAFAKSDKDYLVHLIKEKEIRASSLKVIQESFTRGKPLRLVKRNAKITDFDNSPDQITN